MSLQREAIHLDARQSFRLLHWRDNLREVDSLVAPGQTVRIQGTGDRWHHHPEMELTLVQHGRGTRFVGDHIGPFEALDVVLIGPNVPHFWKGLHASTGYAVQWHFDPAHPLWQIPEAQAMQPLWRHSAHGLRFTSASADAALHLVRQMAATSGLERFSQFLKLLDLLAAAPERHQNRLSQRPFDLSHVHAHQPAIERVIRHVLRGFRDPILLQDALRLAAMSRATFARQFPKHAGKTFSSFVNHVRLDAACRDLLSSDQSISQIAFNNGFNNLSYFNRLFLQTHRCSPRDYRKQTPKDW